MISSTVLHELLLEFVEDLKGVVSCESARTKGVDARGDLGGPHTFDLTGLEFVKARKQAFRKFRALGRGKGEDLL